MVGTASTVPGHADYRNGSVAKFGAMLACGKVAGKAFCDD
jgi:hypothetical protein